MTESKEGFIQVTGGRVWYRLVGKKKGIPLIVLHGGPGLPHDYLEPLEDLSNERQIIFYDQLGCGNSDWPDDNSLWTVERFVEELGQIIKALKLEQYNLFGHSWGTGLAASFALTRPEGLLSLVLAGSFLSTALWEKDAEKLIKQLPQNIQAILKRHIEPGFVDSDEFINASDEFYKRFVWRMDYHPDAVLRAKKKMNEKIYNFMWGPKEFAATGTLKNFDITPRLSEINNPVLLICGRYDEVTPETTEYYKSLFPNARMKVFENSAHRHQWTDREEYIHTIQNFLTEVN